MFDVQSVLCDRETREQLCHWLLLSDITVLESIQLLQQFAYTREAIITDKRTHASGVDHVLVFLLCESLIVNTNTYSEALLRDSIRNTKATTATATTTTATTTTTTTTTTPDPVTVTDVNVNSRNSTGIDAVGLCESMGKQPLIQQQQQQQQQQKQMNALCVKAVSVLESAMEEECHGGVCGCLRLSLLVLCSRLQWKMSGSGRTAAAAALLHHKHISSVGECVLFCMRVCDFSVYVYVCV